MDRETLRQNYVQYITYKRRRNLLKIESVLTFNVKQGWGLLCEFLGHPVPEGIYSFPTCSHESVTIGRNTFSAWHYVDLALGYYRSFDRDGVEKDQVEIDFQHKILAKNLLEIGLRMRVERARWRIASANILFVSSTVHVCSV